MLLTDARRAARTGPDGELIPLTKQDRTLWDQAEITEGVALLTGALSKGTIGAYQLQAAIAAVRAHLLEMAGDHHAAITHCRIAAGRTTSLPERDYLIAQAARLSESSASGEQGNGVR